LIGGETIRLRPFGVEDTDFLLRWNNDPDYTGEFEPFEPVSREELEEWLPKEKPGQLWYIIETASGEKIGQVVGRLQDDGSVQIGYRVIQPSRGMGYCTEAVRSLIDHLHGERGVWWITAEANPSNRPSLRVLEKLGFREIAYKERAVEINGVWLDGVVYELRMPRAP
jgi:RimJ/RimL family protein N-acetyltransferase